MTYSLVVDQTFVLTLFFGVLGLIFALAVLNAIQVAFLASRGLYKPHRQLAVWSVSREGLTMLTVGGVVAYGIYAGLGFWLTAFLLIAGVGLIHVLTGLVRRQHFVGRHHHC